MAIRPENQEILEYLNSRYSVLKTMTEQQEWQYLEFLAHFISIMEEMSEYINIVGSQTDTNSSKPWLTFIRLRMYEAGMDTAVILLKDYINIQKPHIVKDFILYSITLLREVIDTLQEQMEQNDKV